MDDRKPEKRQRSDGRTDSKKPYDRQNKGSFSTNNTPKKPYDRQNKGSFNTNNEPKKPYDRQNKGTFNPDNAPKKPDGRFDRKSDSYTKPRGDYKKPYTPKPKPAPQTKEKDMRDSQPESEIRLEKNFNPQREAKPEKQPPQGLVIGRNAVRELLKSGRAIDKIFVRKGDREGSITVLIAEAISRGIPVIESESAKLDSLAFTSHHQGVVAMAAEKDYVTVDAILQIARDRGEMPLVVVADGIEDPYNLGALIRCMDGVNAHGLIIPKRRASGLTPTVTKSSAGAIEHVPVAKVSNIASTLELLKKEGLWIFGAEAGGQNYYDCDFKVPAAIVFGSEGDGMSRLVTEKCDFIASIPMYGSLNSLNVSTAAAVILSEAARQRRMV